MPLPSSRLTDSMFEYVIPPGIVWPATTVGPPMPNPVIELSVSVPTPFDGSFESSTVSVSTCVVSSTRVLRFSGAT